MKIVHIGIKCLKFLLMTTGVLFFILAFLRFATTHSHFNKKKPSQFQTEKIRKGSLVVRVSCTGTLSAVGTVKVGTQSAFSLDTIQPGKLRYSTP